MPCSNIRCFHCIAARCFIEDFYLLSPGLCCHLTEPENNVDSVILCPPGIVYKRVTRPFSFIQRLGCVLETSTIHFFWGGGRYYNQEDVIGH